MKRETEREEKRLLTGDVSLEELAEIVPRNDELDFVYLNTLIGTRRRVQNILNPELNAAQRNIEKKYLAHLGATAVLDYLPEV